MFLFALIPFLINEEDISTTGAATSVIFESLENVVSSFFGAKFQRSIEEVLVSPVPSHVLLFGYVIGGVTRGLAVGSIVTCMSLFFKSYKETFSRFHVWMKQKCPFQTS